MKILIQSRNQWLSVHSLARQPPDPSGLPVSALRRCDGVEATISLSQNGAAKCRIYGDDGGRGRFSSDLSDCPAMRSYQDRIFWSDWSDLSGHYLQTVGKMAAGARTAAASAIATFPKMQGERPVRWGLHPPPRIHVFCRHVETRRKCPLTAGFSNASFESLVLRTGRRPISGRSLCGKKSRSWRRKGVVARASPRSCRCWMRTPSEICKCGEVGNQGWARPSRSNCSDHSAGASRKLATPMPRGSRPSTAALT